MEGQRTEKLNKLDIKNKGKKVASVVFPFFFYKTWHHRAEGKGQGKATESRQDRRRAKKEGTNREQASGREWGQNKTKKKKKGEMCENDSTKDKLRCLHR